MAGPVYTIYTVGGLEIYEKVFSGVVLIMGSGFAQSASRVFALVGLLILIFQAITNMKFLPLVRYGITIVLISGLMILPKADILLIDRLDPEAPRTVDDVPLSLALFGSITTTLGNSALDRFETAFNTPNAQSYAVGGVVFGARVLSDLKAAPISSVGKSTALAQWMRDCAIPELNEKTGYMKVDEIAQSRDLVDYMSTRVNPGRYYKSLNDDGSEGSVKACDAEVARFKAMTVTLAAEKVAHVAALTAVGSPPETEAGIIAEAPIQISKVNSALRDMSQRLFRDTSIGSQKFSEMMVARQALFDAASSTSSPGASAPELVSTLGGVQAETQSNSVFAASGAQAQKYIPLLKIVMECMFIALFPLLVPAFFLPKVGNSLAWNYFGGFMYFQLWGPLMVVLNSLMIYWADMQGSGAGYVAGVGLGLRVMTLEGVVKHYGDIGLIASNMMLMIPFLAQGVLKGAQGAMSQGEAMLAGARQGASAAATGASQGNFSLGNGSYGNYSRDNESGGNRSYNNFSRGNETAYQVNTAPTTRTGYETKEFVGQNGMVARQSADGVTRYDGGSNNVQAPYMISASDVKSRGVEKATQLSEASQRTFTQNISTGLSGSHGQTVASNVFKALTNSSEITNGRSNSSSISEGVSRQAVASLGVSEAVNRGFLQQGSSVYNEVTGFGVGANASASVGAVAFGTGAAIGANLTASKNLTSDASLSRTTSAQREKAWTDSYLRSEQATQDRSEVATSISSMSATQASTVGRRLDENSSKELKEVASAMMGFSAAQTRSQSMMESYNSGKNMNASSVGNLNAGFQAYADQKLGESTGSPYSNFSDLALAATGYGGRAPDPTAKALLDSMSGTYIDSYLNFDDPKFSAPQDGGSSLNGYGEVAAAGQEMRGRFEAGSPGTVTMPESGSEVPASGDISSGSVATPSTPLGQEYFPSRSGGQTSSASQDPAGVATPQGALGSAIRNAARATGVDENVLNQTAFKESGHKTNAASPLSSAQGPFQFTEGTWLATLDRHGGKHGYSDEAAAISRGADGRYRVGPSGDRSEILGLRNDPVAASLMAAELMKENSSALSSALGRDVSGSEAYAGHLLGARRAEQFLTADANAPLSSVLSAAEHRNNSGALGPRNSTVGESREHLANWFWGGSNSQSAQYEASNSSQIAPFVAPLIAKVVTPGVGYKPLNLSGATQDTFNTVNSAGLGTRSSDGDTSSGSLAMAHHNQRMILGSVVGNSIDPTNPARILNSLATGASLTPDQMIDVVGSNKNGGKAAKP